MKRDWSKEFNALPEEVRVIGCAQEAKVRIQMLLLEKERLSHYHELSLREINQRIKTNSEWLEDLDKPTTPAKPG